MKQTRIIILSICIMAGITSYVNSKKQREFNSITEGILGRWEYLGSDIPDNYITFKEDGECVTRFFYGSKTNYDETVEKYSADGKTIKKYSNNNPELFAEFEYELSNDSLTIKNYVYVETSLYTEQTKTTIYKDAIYKRLSNRKQRVKK